MIKKIQYLAVSAILVGVAMLFMVGTPSKEISYDDEVRNITSAGGEMYPGEFVEKLAELGVEAIPAIAEAMLKEEQFYLTYVTALTRIGDSRATPSLLKLLGGLEPTSEDQRDVCAEIIFAIQTLGGDAAIDPLSELLDGDSTPLKVRLAAAAALARIGTKSEQDAARKVVMGVYNDRSKYYAQRGTWGQLTISEHDLYRALIAVDTSRSLGILMEVISVGTDSYKALPIVDYLGTKNDIAVVRLLREVADNNMLYEQHVRLAAIKSLSKLRDGALAAEIASRLAEFLELEGDEAYEKSLVTEAARIRLTLTSPD